MAIKEVTPQQAHEVLPKDADAVYIDVRTEGEFANGHPAGSGEYSGGFSRSGTRHDREQRLRQGRGSEFSTREKNYRRLSGGTAIHGGG